MLTLRSKPSQSYKLPRYLYEESIFEESTQSKRLTAQKLVSSQAVQPVSPAFYFYSTHCGLRCYVITILSRASVSRASYNTNPED